jgi:biopolymer transport protein ExbB/TolQ
MSELITLFERGGVLMYPLRLASIVALWIFLERLYHLRRADSRAASLFDEVNTLLMRASETAPCNAPANALGRWRRSSRSCCNSRLARRRTWRSWPPCRGARSSSG